MGTGQMGALARTRTRETETHRGCAKAVKAVKARPAQVIASTTVAVAQAQLRLVHPVVVTHGAATVWSSGCFLQISPCCHL